MKSYTVVYESILTFHFLPVEEINRARTVLVQIFSTDQSWVRAEKIAQEIRLFFPRAKIAGLSTVENFTGAEAPLKNPVLCIHTFEEAKVSVASVRDTLHKDSYLAGVELAKKACRRDTRALILYCDPMRLCAPDLAAGIRSVAQEVPMTGLLAADGTQFDQPYLLEGEHSFEGGAVLIALHGNRLSASMREYAFLRKAGPLLPVQKSEGCRLYRLGGRAPLDALRHYLGEAFVQNLPASSYELAFCEAHESGEAVYGIVKVHDDGSVTLTAEAEEGSCLRFAYLPKGYRGAFCPPEPSEGKEVEHYFLFGDLSRSLQRDGTVYGILDLLARRAPVAGALGYGTFHSTTRSVSVSTMSMSVLALGESPTRKSEKRCDALSVPEKEAPSLLAASLSRLTEVMLEETAFEREATKRIIEESERAVLLYDASLRLVRASRKARELLGLDAKLGNEDDLEKLDEWIADALKKGLKESLYTRIGKILDPYSGRPMEIEITLSPVRVDGHSKGAIAYFEKSKKP